MNPKPNIVAAIKALGYNSRQVTVKDGGGSLSWSFTVTVRDPKVDFAAVENAVMKFEEYERDISGDILSGGNTFIHVRPSEEVKEIWAQELLPAVEAAAAQINDEQNSAPIDENYRLRKVDRRGNYDIYRLNYYRDGSQFGSSIGGDHYTLKAIALNMREHKNEEQWKIKLTFLRT